MIKNKYFFINGQKHLKIAFGTSRFGCIKSKDGQFSSSRRNYDQECSILNFAIKSGITIIDTAHDYGLSESIIGDSIKNFDRNKLFICTKVGYNPIKTSQVRKQIELSSKRLNGKPNLVYIHNQNHENLNEIMNELLIAVKNGETDYVGISNFDLITLSIFVKEKKLPIFSYQAKVNVFEPRPDYKILLKFCQDNNLYFFASSSLNRGIMKNSKFITPQKALLFLLKKNIIPIFQSHNQNHISDNLKIFQKYRLN